MTLRASKKYSNQVYLQDSIGSDSEGNEITILDVMSTDTDSIIDQVDLGINVRNLYDKIKTTLKERERLVLEMRYGLGNSEEYTQREISKILGISRSYVSRIEKKAIKKLSQEMQK